MEIQIKGTAYNIRYTIRAMFVFEQITGKIFRLENLTDYYLFYYSLLVANNSDLQMTFEDFINECDDEPALVIQLQEFLSKEMEKQSAFIIRKSKFPQNPKRSVRFSGKRTKRSVQKRKARNTQKAETKVL